MSTPSFNREDAELAAVERFVTKSFEPYNDWDWDGETLTVFCDNKTEKYSRADLNEVRVFAHLPAA